MSRFVLVHGAMGGAWTWEPLIPQLEAAGHRVTAIDLPGAGSDTTPVEDVTLDAYAERVSAVLAEDPEPAILVGHSMGGVVITQAAARSRAHIALLVYVAAFLPRDGQSLLALTELPEGAGDQVQANIVVEGDPPVATMPPAAAPDALFACCTPAVVAWATARLGPQPVAPFAAPVRLGERGIDDVPRAYVLCLRDRAIPTALQRRMIAESPCAHVVEIDTDHCPNLSATSELAAALNEFAAATPSAAATTV
jgi:pimeloyl-ACP methyl ester carboxylesterase